jgi:hypothetical protein
MKYKISLYDDSFDDEFVKFLDRSMTTNCHDHSEVMARAMELADTFNMDGDDTRNAIVGAILMEAIYGQQMIDGTHEKFSHPEEPE